MTKIDLGKIDQIIRETAKIEVMPRFRKLAKGDVEMKGVNDPVTVADRQTEIRLTAELTAAMPDSLVVGEETFAKDKTIMGRLDTDAPIWIIDPIDGTRNFVSGKPEFASMVALVQKKEILAAWIHDPNSGDTIMSEKGSGVWLQGQKLKLAATDPSLPKVGLAGARVKKFLADPTFADRAGTIPPIQLGSCAGFDYPRLFTGPITFANATVPRAAFLFYRHTNAWDHAPGTLLNTEAGGYSADWQGKPYDMAKPLNGLLHAPDRDEWQRLYGLFQPLILHVEKTVSTKA